MIVAARERGLEVTGELELAWRADPEPLLRGHGNERQDDHGRAARAPAPRGRRARRGRRQRRHAARLARGAELDPEATVVCEASSFQLEDTSRLRARVRRVPEPRARTTSTATGRSRTIATAKLRVFANQGNDDVAVYNGDEPELAERDLGGVRPAGRASALEARGGADPDCELSLREGVIFAGEEALLAANELRLLGAHNVENAMARRRRRARDRASPRDAVAEGLRSFEGVAAPARARARARRRRSTSTTPRRPTSPRRWRASTPSRAACTLILGGSLKGESFARLAEPLRSAARRLPDRRGRRRDLADDLRRRGRGRRAVAATAPSSARSRRPPAAARPGEVVLLSPACASFDAFRDFEQRGRSLPRAGGGPA